MATMARPAATNGPQWPDISGPMHSPSNRPRLTMARYQWPDTMRPCLRPPNGQQNGHGKP